MKIAVLSFSAEKGGAARAAQRLVHALREQDQEVEFYSIDVTGSEAISLKKSWGRPEEAKFYAESSVQWQAHARNRPTNWNSQFSFFFSGQDLGFLVDFDLVHIHWGNGFVGFDSLQSLYEIGKPIVWTMHDFNVFTGGCHYPNACEGFKLACDSCPQVPDVDLWKSEVANELQRKLQVFPKLPLIFVSPSEALKTQFDSSRVGESLRCFVVPNPLSDVFFYDRDRQSLRDSRGIVENEFVMLFVAHDTREVRKGARRVLEAIEKYVDMVPKVPFRLLVLGDGAEGLSDIGFPVSFLGSVSDENELAQVYAVADVTLHGAFEDNLPNTVAESLAAGTPVVAFSVGGLPEMLSEISEQCLIPDGDTAGFAKALFDLSIKSKDELRATCRGLALTKFEGVARAKDYLKVYDMAVISSKEKAVPTMESEKTNALNTCELLEKNLEENALEAHQRISYLKNLVNSLQDQVFALNRKCQAAERAALRNVRFRVLIKEVVRRLVRKVGLLK